MCLRMMYDMKGRSETTLFGTRKGFGLPLSPMLCWY